MKISALILINREDIQNCANDKYIKLINHTMKFWKSVNAKRKLSIGTRVSDNQFGFMPGRSTMTARGKRFAYGFCQP